MKFKHTPGPWTVTKCDPIFNGTHGNLLGREVNITGPGFTTPEITGGAMQDATLIAAAPELYEALTHLVNICTHPAATKADMQLIANEARAALAKARGES